MQQKKPEKRLGCRVLGQWLQELEEVVAQVEHHAQVREPVCCTRALRPNDTSVSEKHGWRSG